jgi:hypothetical protein
MRVKLWKTETDRLKGHPAGGCEWEAHTFVCTLAMRARTAPVENGGRRPLQRHFCSANGGEVIIESMERRSAHGDACARLAQTRAKSSANG